MAATYYWTPDASVTARKPLHSNTSWNGRRIRRAVTALPITAAGDSAPERRKGFAVNRLSTVAGAVGVLAVVTLGSSGVAAAGPSGFANFGNAQDTVNALTAAGYTVQINGGTAFPLSSCKVIQVEGLNNSNIDDAGKRIDPTKFDTVYVDVSCRGG